MTESESFKYIGLLIDFNRLVQLRNAKQQQQQLQYQKET